MNKPELSSIKNILFSSKPSTAIRLLLMVLFVCLFANVANAQGTSCANATSLTINGACSSGTISDRTQTAPVASGCSSGAFRREGWYTFTVSGGPLNVNITGVATNRNLFLQLISSTASCTGLSQINCANSNNNNNSFQTEAINTTLSNGIYYIKVVNAGTGNSNMNLQSICITATPTVSSFTPSAGCSNSTPVVITGTNFTGVTAVRFGGTNADSFVVNSSTQITAIPAAGSTGAIRVVTGGGTASSGSNFTVNPAPASPTIGTITHSSCSIVLGSVVVTGLPASGTINQTGTASATYIITGTTMTISGLTAGTYNFTASNGPCTSIATANVVINPIPSNTWNGGWNNGVPNSTQALIFAAGYSSPTDVSGCSCQVNTGVNVTINAPHTLTITNAVTVLGTGTLTFDYDSTFGANPISSASLVQINNVANSGNINYKRRTNTNVISTDYTYWSSPVFGQKMVDLSPNTLPSMFYAYQATATDEGWQQESSGIAMAPGVGYSIGGPKVITPPETYLATFTGVPNNGKITLSNVFADKSYLLGNPYPSAIDANKFLQDNATVLGGTLYFWTHNTAMQDRNLIAIDPITGITTAGSGALAYTSNDYATYNGTGGVGAYDPGSSTSAAVSPGANTSIPSGKIAAGQGFFASTQASIPAGSSIVYNNTIRVGGANNNSQFFKTKNPNTKSVSTIEKHRVWLNLSNTQGAFKQTLVGYITDATNEYDNRFDGETFDGNEFVDFYSINQDKSLVIQGRALPFDENDEVKLGYRTKIKGDFTINIAQTDGLLNNQDVFIQDKLTNKVVNLKEENYTFNTTAGTFNDRFVLLYSNKTLGTTDFAIKENAVQVSIKNQKIQINSFTAAIDKIAVFDLLGRQIYQRGKVNNNEFVLSDFVSSHQTLIVKTSLQNGITVTEKVIY